MVTTAEVTKGMVGMECPVCGEHIDEGSVNDTVDACLRHLEKAHDQEWRRQDVYDLAME